MNIRNLCPKYFMPKSKEDHFCMIEFFLIRKQKQMNQQSVSYFSTVKSPYNPKTTTGNQQRQ